MKWEYSIMKYVARENSCLRERRYEIMGQKKKCTHKFGEVEFTSSEGYSVTCVKCGKTVVFGFEVPIEYYKPTKKYLSPSVVYLKMYFGDKRGSKISGTDNQISDVD